MDSENNLLAYIDYEDGLNRLGGNHELFKRLLSVFMQADHFEPISSAISEGDFVEASRTAHALKGVSANLSLKRLHAVSAELDSRLKHNLDPAESLSELKTVFTATLDAINEII